VKPVLSSSVNTGTEFGDEDKNKSVSSGGGTEGTIVFNSFFTVKTVLSSAIYLDLYSGMKTRRKVAQVVAVLSGLLPLNQPFK